MKHFRFSTSHHFKMSRLDILFSSNHNIHKSSYGFWASDPLIDRFYYNLSIKRSEGQKQRPNELLWMLWFDEKLYLSSLGIRFHKVLLLWTKFRNVGRTLKPFWNLIPFICAFRKIPHHHLPSSIRFSHPNNLGVILNQKLQKIRKFDF